MARRAMKAEKAKMMDSMVLENVRVWKSSITHELHVQPMKCNHVSYHPVAVNHAVMVAGYLARVRRTDTVWDPLKPHARAIFSADRSARWMPAMGAHERDAPGGETLAAQRSGVQRGEAPAVEGAEQSTDDEGEQEDREARRDEERKARKKHSLCVVAWSVSLGAINA
jgi:hypothetical protein